jgi:hypothetical protein
VTRKEREREKERLPLETLKKEFPVEKSRAFFWEIYLPTLLKSSFLMNPINLFY